MDILQPLIIIIVSVAITAILYLHPKRLDWFCEDTLTYLFRTMPEETKPYRDSKRMSPANAWRVLKAIDEQPPYNVDTSIKRPENIQREIMGFARYFNVVGASILTYALLLTLALNLTNSLIFAALVIAFTDPLIRMGIRWTTGTNPDLLMRGARKS